MQGISETIFSVIHSNENMINVKKEKKSLLFTANVSLVSVV